MCIFCLNECLLKWQILLCITLLKKAIDSFYLFIYQSINVDYCTISCIQTKATQCNTLHVFELMSKVSFLVQCKGPVCFDGARFLHDQNCWFNSTNFVRFDELFSMNVNRADRFKLQHHNYDPPHIQSDYLIWFARCR